MTRSRAYKSIYFEGARLHCRKKGDVTVSFSSDEELYSKIRSLSSLEIKRIIGLTTYGELLEAAKREHRTSGNLIKHRLTLHFEHE